jgi:hypothetical protein
VLCTTPSSKAHCRHHVLAGFPMDRTTKGTGEVAKRLTDGLGEIIRKRNDYDSRQGITQTPLTEQDIIHAARGVHKFLRVLTWYETFLFRLVAGTHKWQGGVLSERQKENNVKGRSKCLEVVAKNTGIVLDTPTSKGGTTDTGNTAKRFFSHELIPSLKSLLPEGKQESALQIHWKLSIILRVFNSRRRVHLVLFQV